MEIDFKTVFHMRGQEGLEGGCMKPTCLHICMCIYIYIHSRIYILYMNI